MLWQHYFVYHCLPVFSTTADPWTTGVGVGGPQALVMDPVAVQYAFTEKYKCTLTVQACVA